MTFTKFEELAKRKHPNAKLFKHGTEDIFSNDIIDKTEEIAELTRQSNFIKENMINYLQQMLNKFKKMEAKNTECPNYYRESEMNRIFDDMMACKEMAEAVIGEPANLQKDGKVTIEF